MSKTFRILSLDAGGIRALLPALLLSELEQRSGRPLYQSFDLICGTGTGALLALALSIPAEDGRPLGPDALMPLFEAPRARLYCRPAMAQFSAWLRGAKPRYAHTVLSSWAKRYYAKRSLADALTPVLIPSYDLESRQPHFAKSWKAQGQLLHEGKESAEDRNYRIPDLIGASLAEPGLFDPKVLGTQSGKRLTLVDGNLFAANPAMCALMSAQRLAPDASRFHMLSLGTGRDLSALSFVDARFWTQEDWRRHMLNVSLDGFQGSVDYQMQAVATPPNTYVRINPDLELNTPVRGSDDLRPAVIRALHQAAQRSIERDANFARALRAMEEN